MCLVMLRDKRECWELLNCPGDPHQESRKPGAKVPAGWVCSLSLSWLIQCSVPVGLPRGSWLQQHPRQGQCVTDFSTFAPFNIFPIPLCLYQHSMLRGTGPWMSGRSFPDEGPWRFSIPFYIYITFASTVLTQSPPLLCLFVACVTLLMS